MFKNDSKELKNLNEAILNVVVGHVNEDVEQVDELNYNTLVSYKAKAKERLRKTNSNKNATYKDKYKAIGHEHGITRANQRIGAYHDAMESKLPEELSAFILKGIQNGMSASDLAEEIIDIFESEIEQLDELSPATKDAYRQKAAKNLARRAFKAAGGSKSSVDGSREGSPGKRDPKIAKRAQGIGRAGGSEQQARHAAAASADAARKMKKERPADEDEFDDDDTRRSTALKNARNQTRKAGERAN